MENMELTKTASLKGNGNNVVNGHNEEILKNVVQYGVCPHLGVTYRAGNFLFWIDLNVNSVNHHSTQGKQWQLCIILSIMPDKDGKQWKPCRTIF